MRSLFSIWSTAFVIVMLSIGVVHAAPPPEVDALHAQGLAAFKRKDYEAARVAFAREYELLPRTSTLLNLALAELNSGHPLEAVKHMRMFIAAVDAPQDKVDEVRTKMLPRAEAQIGRLQIDAPSGARVFVDGVDVGMAPLPDPVDVLPGTHEIVVKLGADSDTTRVPVAAGDVSRVRVMVMKGGASTPQPAPSPTPSSAPPPSVAPPQAKDAPVAPPPPSSSATRTKVVIVIAGGAIVSTVVAVIFDSASRGDRSDADSLRAQLVNNSACVPPSGQPIPPQCGALRDAVSSQNTHQKLAAGFYIGGGALAVGAIATWFLWPTSKDAPRAWVRPILGSTSGLEVGGRF